MCKKWQCAAGGSHGCAEACGANLIQHILQGGSSSSSQAAHQLQSWRHQIGLLGTPLTAAHTAALQPLTSCHMAHISQWSGRRMLQQGTATLFARRQQTQQHAA